MLRARYPSLSLLLTLQSMTPTWCYRRAEAVLKAVKGSLMELASMRGGGQVLQTLIFLLPPELPAKSFESFAGLVNSSFQQTNPIVASTAS